MNNSQTWLKSAKYYTPEEIELTLRKIFSREDLVIADSIDFDSLTLPDTLTLSAMINEDREDRDFHI